MQVTAVIFLITLSLSENASFRSFATRNPAKFVRPVELLVAFE